MSNSVLGDNCFQYFYTCLCGISVTNRTEHDTHTLFHMLESVEKKLNRKWWEFWK